MKEKVRNIILKTLPEAGVDELVVFDVDSPPSPSMGDFACNVAMIIAKEKKEDPKKLAQKISQALAKEEGIKSVEVAGPGFINITLDEGIYHQELRKILGEKDKYGCSNAGKGKKVQVEYISANPTGPLHIGNARGGPIGEAIANIYKNLGYQIEREFYVNDIGGQINKLGETLYYWNETSAGQELDFPEDGYKGKYVEILADEIKKDKKAEIDKISEKEDIINFYKVEGVKRLVNEIKADAESLGIKFDKWVYQSQFEKGDLGNKIIDHLRRAKATVQKEGAVWFKDSDDPDIRDRECVLKKSDGEGTLTYFIDDIVYHKDKYDRGFDMVINVWGANHHGHVARLKSALRYFDIADDWLKIILYQHVSLIEKGKKISMSKREGNFVTLRQIIESGVSADAFKYFILSQNPQTPIEFDLDLAKDESVRNPVYYIKYAHARICSILRKVEGKGDSANPDFSNLSDAKEIALYKELAGYPDILLEISENFQIQALPHYVYKIASLFHDFYSSCQVLSRDKKLTASRLSLIKASKIVIKNALATLSIEAPERM